MTTQPVFLIGAGKAKELNVVDGEMSYVPCEMCRFGESAKTFKRDKDGLWCPNTYGLILHEEEHGPFIFYVKGTAMSPFQRAIISPVLQRRDREGIIDPWRFTYSLKTRIVENEKGKFYVPEVAKIGDTEDMKRFHDMAVALDTRVSDTMSQAAEDEGQAGLPEED